jgi:hypothetical protein
MEIAITYEATGEYREPMQGEWFEGNRGYPLQARFDFQATQYRILRQIITRVDSCHSTAKGEGK